jgi:hypothetical protein
MIHLTFSYWWLFGLAILLILVFGGDGMGAGLLLTLVLLIFLVTAACKVAAHFGVL